MSNGKQYSKIEERYFDNITPNYIYERVESLKVYRSYNNSSSCPELEYVYYDFEISDSTLWQICPIYYGDDYKLALTFFTYYDLFQKTIETKDFLYVPVIENDTIYEPLGTPGFMNVAKSVGKVIELRHNDGYYKLYGAIINGNKYGVITSLETYSMRNIKSTFILDCYPNPFNSIINVEFSFPFEQQVYISLLNLLGEEVKQISSKIMQQGHHFLKVSLSDLSSGTYIIMFRYGSEMNFKKIVLLK